MKKIFVAVMAMAAFAACSNEEQIAAPQGQEIAFGDAFVDNATKAIYEGANKLTQFTVWGSVNNVPLYGTTGATVEGDAYDGIWTCDETRYWTPSCNFKFFATAHATVAESDVVDGIPTKFSYTADGTTDLLCSTGIATATTDAAGTPTAVAEGSLKKVGEESVVAFTMKHLLSRIAFKFTVAADLYPDYTYGVENVQVTGAYATGDCTPAGVWSNQDGAIGALQFANIATVDKTNGSAAEGAYVIIPGTQDLTIKFDAVCYLNGTEIKTYQYSIPVTNELLANNAYTFVAELPLPGNPIKFTVVEVDGWDDADDDVDVQ